ncbi:MAG: c-type cytochrome [Caldilineaceae bacterium SB0664_bin_27]|uniref:C-type cytochrome n=1 Tax=Caldilineaceae bacterium SB0664_bin_27 TaxID=2605260 RepID=A0A6B0YN79_9CHLR|nr:c-type cytochrome [Caldilineaceae bacterium SB0664_bin_27]
MIRTGCNSCHFTTGLPEADSAMLGPDQTNLGAIAGTRREGYTAEEYLREAILEPSAFIVEECPLGPCLQVMPENYGEQLTEEEIDAIVAYLLSLTTDE